MLSHVLAGCNSGYADEATQITKRFHKTNLLTVNCSRNHFRCRIIVRLCKQHVFTLEKVRISSSGNSYAVRVQVSTAASKTTVFWDVAPCSLVQSLRDYTPQHPRRLSSPTGSYCDIQNDVAFWNCTRISPLYITWFTSHHAKLHLQVPSAHIQYKFID
jgi:hypothetical protein